MNRRVPLKQQAPSEPDVKQAASASPRAEEREPQARHVIEARFGHSLSDDTWRSCRERLVTFARILRSWLQNARVRT